jgi:hypothetical protein
LTRKKYSKKTQQLLILLGLILTLIVVLPLINNSFMLGLWPGTEGLDAGVAGYQTAQTDNGKTGYWSTKEEFPVKKPDGSSYSPRYRWTQWPTVDPYNTLIARTDDYFLNTKTQTLRVERQTPTRDESVAGKQIEYWIFDKAPDGSNRKTKIVGTVVPWTFVLQISIVPGTNSYLPYFQEGEAVWFGLGTKVWNRAYGSEASTNYVNYAGWSIPISVYIEQYNPYGKWSNNDNTQDQTPKSEWVAECVQITPDYSGRTVTLFSDPTTPVSLDDMWYQGSLNEVGLSQALQALNGTLAPDPRPDTAFANHAYFKFTFTKFNPKEEYDWLNQHTATWYPSVYYKLRVYYLELGEFVYVEKEQNLPSWDPRVWAKTFTPLQDWWNSFFGALGVLNPFGIFGPWAPFVAFLFTLFVIGIIIIVLLAIFAPWVLPRITGSLGHAIGSYKRERKATE